MRIAGTRKWTFLGPISSEPIHGALTTCMAALTNPPLGTRSPARRGDFSSGKCKPTPNSLSTQASVLNIVISQDILNSQRDKFSKSTIMATQVSPQKQQGRSSSHPAMIAMVHESPDIAEPVLRFQISSNSIPIIKTRCSSLRRKSATLSKRARNTSE